MNARLDASQLARYRNGDYSVPGYYNLLQCSRVLMLQGPMGTFFNRVAAWLGEQGIAVKKINFSGGDWLFHRKLDAVDYRGELSDFPAFLRDFLLDHDIDGIVCFGDCRHYHAAAKPVADALGVPFFVFEEGYVRPNYITLECGGVNAYTSVPRSAAFYRALPEVEIPTPQPVNPRFARGAWASMLYYAASRVRLIGTIRYCRCATKCVTGAVRGCASISTVGAINRSWSSFCASRTVIISR
jgi:capsular polysaccharide export protein